MKAVVIKETGIAALVDIEQTPLQTDYFKVKTVVVAVNPTDLHHTAGAGRVGGILGCELSGIVEEVGKDCKSNLKKGDAVYGVCHCANLSSEHDGAFAEYALVRDGHIAKIPEGMSFEDTAGLGVGITAIGQSLYMIMKLPLPGETPVNFNQQILINGGASATGTLAIQFAKLSGLNVVTTASPANFELVKSRGADAVFDYHATDCAQKIKEYTKHSLHLVLDCISTKESYNLIARALPDVIDESLQVITLLPPDTWPREDVKPTTILAYTSFGKAFTKFGIDFPAMPAHFDFGVKFWDLSNQLLKSGQIKPHPIAVRGGGLSGIAAGLAEHAQFKVRGVKLIYKVSETENEMSVAESAIKAPELGSKW